MPSLLLIKVLSKCFTILNILNWIFFIFQNRINNKSFLFLLNLLANFNQFQVSILFVIKMSVVEIDSDILLSYSLPIDFIHLFQCLFSTDVLGLLSKH